MQVLRWWWVVVAAGTTAATTAGLMWWLLAKVAAIKDVPIVTAQCDAIGTSLSVRIGGGGALALWLTARRQRSTELQLQQTVRLSEDNKTHAERVAEAAEFDLRERRITVRGAIDPIGSEGASVRLGGLYLLERAGDREI